MAERSSDLSIDVHKECFKWTIGWITTAITAITVTNLPSPLNAILALLAQGNVWLVLLILFYIPAVIANRKALKSKGHEDKASVGLIDVISIGTIAALYYFAGFVGVMDVARQLTPVKFQWLLTSDMKIAYLCLSILAYFSLIHRHVSGLESNYNSQKAPEFHLSIEKDAISAWFIALGVLGATLHSVRPQEGHIRVIVKSGVQQSESSGDLV